MTIAEALAERVNELLSEHDITQYRLSMLSGVPQSSISDIRNMRNKTVNIKLISEISQGLNISVREFFDSPLFDYENISD